MVWAIGNIALLAIPVIGVAVPIYVLVSSFVKFRRAKKERGYILLKAFGALTGWAIASYLIFISLFITFLTARDPDLEANAKAVALRLVILCVVYGLVGCSLALWSQHRADNEPINIFSSSPT